MFIDLLLLWREFLTRLCDYLEVRLRRLYLLLTCQN